MTGLILGVDADVVSLGIIISDGMSPDPIDTVAGSFVVVLVVMLDVRWVVPGCTLLEACSVGVLICGFVCIIVGVGVIVVLRSDNETFVTVVVV